MKQLNRVVGIKGERAAHKYLEQKGYKIVCTNYTNHIGEIDIIAIDNEYVVFVEVKTRTTTAFGLPSEAVTAHKQRQISMVAAMFVKQKRLFDNSIRFDIIEVEADTLSINHIVDAFYSTIRV